MVIENTEDIEMKKTRRTIAINSKKGWKNLQKVTLTHLDDAEKAGVNKMLIKSVIRVGNEKQFDEGDLEKLRGGEQPQRSNDDGNDSENDYNDSNSNSNNASEKITQTPNSDFFKAAQIYDSAAQPFLNFSKIQDLTKTNVQFDAAKSLAAATPKQVKYLNKMKNREATRTSSFDFDNKDISASSAYNTVKSFKGKRLSELKIIARGGQSGRVEGTFREDVEVPGYVSLAKDREDTEEWQMFHLGKIAEFKKTQKTLPTRGSTRKCQWSLHQEELPIKL